MGWRRSCDIGEAMLILQSFCHFTYITAHSTALPLLHQYHRHFTYITAHSPTLPSLYLCHSSFSYPSAASSTPQLILQPFFCFTYITGHSTTLLFLHLHHRHFMYFTWRAAHAQGNEKNSLWWTSLLQPVTKFRSSYSFGQLLRILLRAVNLFSFSQIVSSDSSFNIHNALYFVKYPSRADKTRALKIPDLGKR